ncbi:MAG: sigma-70 family RNA polymerase sigma factor [Acidobacteria bacterium]|nr:sigma-70 family RNA polymerase sigma factor [Acidobacteriota bacterium]HQZ38412.1 sigma-70 family RNA polymerase sigma factor [Vicinamibacterales bacterium]
MRDQVVESRLVERLRQQDETALAELASAYGSKIFQLAFRYVKNREDAEEVTQDVLMKVFQKIETFRGDAALSSWIHRITFNTAMSRLRHTRTARTMELSDVPVGTATDDPTQGPRPHDPADWSALADEQLLRQQMRECFAAAVGELPSIYRTPVILRDVQGLSTEEASRRLKLKDQTLKSRLHRGRLMLRKRLEVFADGLTLHHPIEAH